MAVFALVGCSKNEGGGNLDPEAKTPISISTTITRATDTEFEDGDKIGLYVVNYNGSAHEIAAEGNHVTNADFSFNGTAWTPGEEIFWRDMVTHADFYAYYPFIETIADVYGGNTPYPREWWHFICSNTSFNQLFLRLDIRDFMLLCRQLLCNDYRLRII